MFDGLFVVLVIAVLTPLIVGFVPWIPLPDPVLEIMLGIVVGPSVHGWVYPDGLLAAVSTIGLAFLLFLAGLELDLTRLRGKRLLATSLGLIAPLVSDAGLRDSPAGQL